MAWAHCLDSVQVQFLCPKKIGHHTIVSNRWSHYDSHPLVNKESVLFIGFILETNIIPQDHHLSGLPFAISPHNTCNDTDSSYQPEGVPASQIVPIGLPYRLYLQARESLPASQKFCQADSLY